MAAMFAYIAGSPFLFQEHFKLSPQTFSFLFAINGAGIIASAQITGKLAGKVREEKMLVTGLITAVLSSTAIVSMLWLDLGIIPVIIPLFLAVSCVGAVGTSSFSLAMGNKGKAAGSAAALHGLMPHVFGALAAPLVGLGGNSILPMGLVMMVCHASALFLYFFLCGKNIPK